MRQLARLVSIAALAMAALVAAESAESERRPALELTAAGGPLAITNSQGGEAIVSARRMGPGDDAAGELRIEVRGGPAKVSLARRGHEYHRGAGGGMLGDVLRLRILVQRDGRWDPLYSGELNDFDRLYLGAWRAGTARRYRFEVAFRDATTARGGLPDDTYQGARCALDFVWKAAAT